MEIGTLAGANSEADMIRVDNLPNVWIDHNELHAVNNECNGSPGGDLTVESAINIKKGATNVTVSYNYIHDSKQVGLDGSSSSDIAGGRKPTHHHNHYKNVNTRLPLQCGGWIHVYYKLYDGITGSSVNVRQKGYALIERNYFQNAHNPVTCRYDSVCGNWELRSNNATSAADNARYNIAWDAPGSGEKNADNWATDAYPNTHSRFDPHPNSDTHTHTHTYPASTVTGTGDYPNGFSKYANLGESCAIDSGTGWVAFGRKGKWVATYVGVGKNITCYVAAFGQDPAGDTNKCSTQK